MKPWLSLLPLFFLLFTAGCSDKGIQSAESAPVAPDNSSDPVAPTVRKADVTTGIPSNAADTYRIRTAYVGPSQAEFSVFINGSPVADYRGNPAETNVTSFLNRDKNQVRIVWKSDPRMEAYQDADLYLEINRNGQWSALVSRRIKKGTASGEATYRLRRESGSENPLPPQTDAPQANSDTNIIKKTGEKINPG